METKVILDEKSFKALSADSRVSILKKLKERRMTLSELSQRLMLKNSTVKEHCSILLNADLITKIDEGRKWKYYQLTGKGKQVIAPSLFEEAKVFVMLSFSAIIIAGIILFGLQFNGINSNMNEFMGAQKVQTLEMPNTIEDSFLESIPEVSSNLEEQYLERNNNQFILETNYFSIGILLTLVIGIFIGLFFGRRLN